MAKKKTKSAIAAESLKAACLLTEIMAKIECEIDDTQTALNLGIGILALMISSNIDSEEHIDECVDIMAHDIKDLAHQFMKADEKHYGKKRNETVG